MSVSLRVGVVQFAPEIGKVQDNLARARELCKGLTPRSMDLLCFPEMIFTGYMFPDAASIHPYLENPRTGPTSVFCAGLARRLECYVTAGFPERLEHGDLHSHSLALAPVGANSAVLYGPAGNLISLYHKTNLLEVDRHWARPGDGFTVIDLPLPLGKTTIAICNDLNAKSSSTWGSIKDGPYELANYCMRQGTRLLVILNAWESEDEESGNDEEPDWSLIGLWSSHLRSTWASDGEPKKHRHRTGSIDSNDLTVVFCNRSGYEGGLTFGGSSSMFLMHRGSGKPQLLDAMGQQEEGVRIWSMPINP